MAETNKASATESGAQPKTQNTPKTVAPHFIEAAGSEASGTEVTSDEVASASAGIAQVEATVPTDADIAEVKQSISQLFEIMGVKRVISVDDDYEGTLEDLIGMAQTAAAVGAGNVTDFAEEFDLTEPVEVWQSQLSERWDEADDTDRHLLIARAKKETGNSDPEQQPDAGALHHLMPIDISFAAWTPADWREKADEVIETSDELPTLVLLDRNFGDRSDEGLRLAEELFAKDSLGKLYVAILTRTVDKGGEASAWKELVESFPRLVPERFVLVSKEHLGPQPKSFPQSIKVILTTRAAALLLKVVKRAINDGMEHANSEVAKLTPEDFERMIFLTSMKEGIWEPESLLRVFQIFMRNVVRGSLYGSEDLRRSATEVRRLCTVQTLEPPDSHAAIVTQQAELYDFPEHLNSVHLPVDLGDVFQNSNAAQFMLTEQPCDLMVRSNGARGNEIHDAVLLPIRFEKPNVPHVAFELPFYRDNGKSGWVYLNKIILVPMHALDMTVFNRNGESRFNDQEAIPDGLWPAWEKRYELLREKVYGLRSTLESIERLRRDEDIDDALQKKLVDSLLQADKGSGRSIKVTVESSGTIRYDIKRVRRILPLRARAVLSRYALHKARDVFDFDLAAIGDS